MKDYTFFDKRYLAPVKFTGELLFETQINRKKFQFFKTSNETCPYCIVFSTQINTEIYPVKNISNLLYSLNDHKDSLRELAKFFRVNEYISQKNDKYAFFQEEYHLYLSEINCEQILFIETDSIKYKILSNLRQQSDLRIPEWGVSNIPEIRYGSKLWNDLKPTFERRIAPEDKHIKYLNSPKDGIEKFDTYISSIKENKYLYIYGNEKIIIKEKYSIILIKTNSDNYLIINDKIYKDQNISNLLLNLPAEIYCEYLDLDKKHHIVLDQNNNIEFINSDFNNQTYTQIKLPINLNKYKEKNSMSEFIKDRIDDLEFADTLNFSISKDGLKINQEDIDYYTSIELKIKTEPYPIFTNLEIIIQKTYNNKNYYLLSSKSSLNKKYMIITESKSKNTFYSFKHLQILYLLSNEEFIPFTLDEIVRNFGKYTELEWLGKI